MRRPTLRLPAFRTRFFSISYQLRYGILLLVMAILLLTGGSLIYLSFQAQLKQVRIGQQERSRAAATTITSYLNDLNRNLAFLARVRGLSDLPPATQRALLEGLTRYNSAYEIVALVDKAGQPVVAVSPYGQRLPANLLDSSFFARTVRGEDFIGPVEIDPTTQVPVVTLAMPVRNQQNRLDGVLMARINLKFLSGVLAQTNVGEAGYAYVVDNRLLLIAEKGRGAKDVKLEDLSSRSFVDMLKQGTTDSSVLYAGLRGGQVLGAFASVERMQWKVVVELPTAEAYSPIRNMVLVMGSALGSAVLITIALGFFFARQIIDPLQQLTNAANQLGAGNLDVIVPVQSRNELGILANTFNATTTQLRDLINRLAHYNQTLEHTVKLRTADLAQAMSEAQEAQVAAEQANQLKTKFLASMSHELRTPLNVIINFSELLLSRTYGDLSDQQAMLQRRVLVNGEHLLGLINDILDLSKIESGRMDLLQESVDLRPILEGVLATAAGLSKDKDLRLDLELPQTELPSVWGDRTRIRQVLLNLVSNATKFTAEGSITVRASARDDGWVEIEVSDTGIGIAPEHQQMIFEEFQQLDNDLNRQFAGTGLGLPICKKLIEMHGGTISLESCPGKGTTFRFTLPVTSSRWAAGAFSGIANARPGGAAEQGMIVVVGDDPDTQMILQHCLEGAGWQTMKVTESREAVEVIRRTRPQVVVLDIRMPYVDGWTVLADLQQDPVVARTPVVVCSVVDPDGAQVGMVSGVEAWLVKPVRESEVLAVVQPYSRSAGRVLVVDDNVDVRMMVCSILERAGWQVAEAADGEQALAFMREERPQVVILDLVMPVMDGFEVLQHLRKMPGREDVVVVVLTAKDLDVQERAWLTERTQYCCQKAVFPASQLPELIQRLM